MTAGVYAIVNIATGMAYIGSSKNIEQRWRTHLSNLKYLRFLPPALIEDWKAASGVGFDLKVLEELPAEDEALTSAEQAWMDRYGDLVYNVHRRAARSPVREVMWDLTKMTWNGERWCSCPHLGTHTVVCGYPPTGEHVIGECRYPWPATVPPSATAVAAEQARRQAERYRDAGDEAGAARCNAIADDLEQRTDGA